METLIERKSEGVPMAQEQIIALITKEVREAKGPMLLDELLKKARFPEKEHYRVKEIIRELVLSGKLELTRDWRLQSKTAG